MPINVKHGANPSVVLAADFATGRELERKRTLLPALQAEEVRKAREDEQAFRAQQVTAGQAFEEKMVKQGQGFRTAERVAGQDFVSDENALRAGDAFDLQGQRQADEEKLLGMREGFEGDRDMARREAVRESHRQEMMAKGYEFVYTPAQQATNAKLQQSEADVWANDGMNEKEKRESVRRLRLKREANQPTMQKRASPWPKGQDVGDHWTDKESGLVYTRTPDGTPKKIGEDRTQPTWNDKLKRVELEQQRITNALKYAQTVDGGVDAKKYEEFMSKQPPMPPMPGMTPE